MAYIPKQDFMLCEPVITESAAVSSTDIQDTHQKFKVLDVGKGAWYDNVFVEPEVTVGDIVIVMKHADADTPRELEERGLYLIKATRVIAVEV